MFHFCLRNFCWKLMAGEPQGDRESNMMTTTHETFWRAGTKDPKSQVSVQCCVEAAEVTRSLGVPYEPCLSLGRGRGGEAVTAVFWFKAAAVHGLVLRAS